MQQTAARDHQSAFLPIPPESAASYNRARYYDPNPGRFLSEDPIGFAGEQNFYSYVNNRVVNFDDPFGLCPQDPKCHCGCTKCHIVRMLVTGYDNSYQSTGKNPGEPGYGITKSGKKAGPGSIAAPKRIPMGTGRVAGVWKICICDQDGHGLYDIGLSS